MSSLRDAVIDEVRWPRMFQTLRRAGLYRDCGCAGCGSCQAAARRFLLGSARTAYFRGFTPSSRNAAVARFERPLGHRSLSLLAERQRGWPTIVNVSLASNRPEAWGEDDEGSWPQAIAGRTWPSSAHVRRLTSVPFNVGAAPTHSWKGPVLLSDYARPNALPRAPGLYLLIWADGAYLGSATSSGGIYQRIREHHEGVLRLSYGPPEPSKYKVYYLQLRNGDEARDFERRYLNAIIHFNQAAPLAATPVRQQRYKDQGFRNRKELETSSPG